ncbi:MAG: acyl-CoA synthetase, partial [Woeseia sp.]
MANPTTHTYEKLCVEHRWHLPEHYNIAQDVGFKHPPDKLAMIFESHTGEQREVTWGELQRDARRMANVLAANGVVSGDRVAMLLTPRPETAAAFLACYASGAILLSMSVLYGDDGIRYRVTDSGAKVIVTNAEHAERVRAMQLPVEKVIVLNRELLDSAPDEFQLRNTLADDPAQIYYTSGTTGLAKGILHAQRYLLAHEEMQYCHDIQDGERFHGMGEWAWAAGISPLLGAWRLGAVQVVYERKGGFDPHEQLAFMARHKVSNVFTTPTAMRSMMRIDNAGTRYPQQLRVVCSAGEPLNPEA